MSLYWWKGFFLYQLYCIALRSSLLFGLWFGRRRWFAGGSLCQILFGLPIGFWAVYEVMTDIGWGGRYGDGWDGIGGGWWRSGCA